MFSDFDTLRVSCIVILKFGNICGQKSEVYIRWFSTPSRKKLRDPKILLALANLAARNLVERASPLDDFNNPRFTCLLDSDAAYDLADTIRLPLGRYLPS